MRNISNFPFAYINDGYAPKEILRKRLPIICKSLFYYQQGDSDGSSKRNVIFQGPGFSLTEKLTDLFDTNGGPDGENPYLYVIESDTQFD
jgi:hypothetical protein